MGIRLPINLAFLSTLLASCVNTHYGIDPPQAAAPVPESEQAGYMRILGDLRWDELTSKEEWMKRFPKCLNDVDVVGRYNYTGNGIAPLKKFNMLSNNFWRGQEGIVRDGAPVPTVVPCWDFFKVGGIPVNLSDIRFAANSGTKSGEMTEAVTFYFKDDSQSRAVRSVLAQKYALQTMGHCSKYTCYVIGDSKYPGPVKAIPTPHTVLLLGRVQLDTSEL